MSEISPQEIATFWKFPVVNLPIEKLSIHIKRNVSLNPHVKMWETADPIVAAQLKFPITEQDVLNVMGPGEYYFMLRYQKPNGRQAFYGNGTVVKVGISPETERLKAMLADHEITINKLMGTVNMLIEGQALLVKLVGAQINSTDSQLNDQVLKIELVIPKREVKNVRN